MLDLEKQALAALPDRKRPRFEFLLRMRQAAARITAQAACFGVIDSPALDRQVVLLEDAITNMIDDLGLSAALSAEWAVNDAALLHSTGQTDWCAICTNQPLDIFAELGY